MNALRRRAAGGRLARFANAVAAGTLAVALGSTVTSCSSDKSAALAARDTTTSVVVAQTSAGEATPSSFRADCMSCHTRAHDAVLGAGSPAAIRCEECHSSVHKSYRQVEALYAGETRDSAVHADPMFTAHVKCVECHATTTLAATGPRRAAALDAACTSCHGPRFAGMLPRWSAGMRWRTRAVSEYLNQAAADARLTPAGRARVQNARQSVLFVAAAGGAHNVLGADALLRGAIDSTAAAYAAAGVVATGAPSLGPDPARVSCVRCHYGIEAARGSAFGLPFDHVAHVVRADVACTKCHSSADYFVARDSGDATAKGTLDPRHGKTTVSAASCEGCHHAPTTAAACATCHAGEARLTRGIAVTLPLKLRPRGAPTSRTVIFNHRDHAAADCATCHTSRPTVRTVAECSGCHVNHHKEATQCAKCHGNDTHASHKAADHLNCVQCHARDTVALVMPNRAFCVTCHADRTEHKPGRECSTCHMQSTPAELQKRILAGPRQP